MLCRLFHSLSSKTARQLRMKVNVKPQFYTMNTEKYSFMQNNKHEIRSFVSKGILVSNISDKIIGKGYILGKISQCSVHATVYIEKLWYLNF